MCLCGGSTGLFSPASWGSRFSVASALAPQETGAKTHNAVVVLVAGLKPGASTREGAKTGKLVSALLKLGG